MEELGQNFLPQLWLSRISFTVHSSCRTQTPSTSAQVPALLSVYCVFWRQLHQNTYIKSPRRRVPRSSFTETLACSQTQTHITFIIVLGGSTETTLSEFHCIFVLPQPGCLIPCPLGYCDHTHPGENLPVILQINRSNFLKEYFH